MPSQIFLLLSFTFITSSFPLFLPSHPLHPHLVESLSPRSRPVHYLTIRQHAHSSPGSGNCQSTTDTSGLASIVEALRGAGGGWFGLDGANKKECTITDGKGGFHTSGSNAGGAWTYAWHPLGGR